MNTVIEASMTETQLVEALLKLRHAADQARTQLMLALMEAEKLFSAKVAAWGHASFDAFIKAHDFCRPDAYRDFVASMTALGDKEEAKDMAEEIGDNAVRFVAKVPAERRKDFVASMVQTVKDSGKKASLGAARSAAIKCGMPTTLRSLNNARETEQLRAENIALRAENQKLRRENERLKRKLAGKSAA